MSQVQVSNSPVATGPQDPLVDSYEQLRVGVLAGTPGPRLGWAVLRREGLAGWINIWSRLRHHALQDPAAKECQVVSCAAATSDDELARLLATMALCAGGKVSA